jgi:hypothetical protein
MMNLLRIRHRGEQTMALHYQITVKEYLEDSWAAWFDGLTLTHGADGATTLAGPVRDQTALYGLLDKARDLGLTLLAVTAATDAAPPASPDSAAPGPRSDIE